MSIGMILKVFSDCCVCFAILGAFPAVFAHSYSLLLPALLCGAVAGMASFLKSAGKERLSRSCVLLTLPCLLMAGTFNEMLILFPVIIYTSAAVLRGQLHLEYYAYRQYFLRSLILLGALYVCLCAFSFMESLAPSEPSVIDASVTLRYSLVHLICGVVLQRQLRLGMANQSRGNHAQLAAMLGGTGAVLLGFLVAEPLLRKGATTLFQAILSLALSAIMAVLELFFSLLDQVELNTMYEEVAQRRGDIEPGFITMVASQIQQSLQEDESRSLWWIVLVAIILLVAITIMLASFRRQTIVLASEEIVTKLGTPEAVKKQSRRSARGKVRHYYREFLRMEKKRGLELKKNYTTEDILMRVSSDTNSDAASFLRQLYLQARYDTDSETTREMAEQARTALRRSRGGTNSDT